MQASDSGLSAASDQTDPLSALALRLSEAGALTVAEESRFAWMLRASGLVPRRAPELGPSVVEPGMTAAEAAFAVLRRHCGAFLRHEPGTRVGDDPEHLHDMRVATRRMRAALRVFANALPPDDARLLREELRATADALGTVRDLDVQIEQMETWAASLITVPREAAQPLVDALRRRRGVARERLLEHLDSRRFRLLKALLVRRLRGGPARQPDRGSPPSGASEPIRAMAPRLIRRARRKVVRAAGKIETSSPPAAYHALRIRGKRFRYALEFLEPLHGTPSRRLIEVLVQMQDVLGLHQDAQVSMALLHDLVQHEAGLPPSCLVAAGEISQMLVARAERLRAEFPEAYRRLRGKRWRSWKKVARASLARARAEGAMGPSAGVDPRVAPNPESTGGQDGGLSPEWPSDSAEG
jgi:CHAD domain-containing protein